MARKKGKGKSKEDDDGGASGRIRALAFGGMLLLAGLAGSVVVMKLIDSYQTQIAEAQAPAETVEAVMTARSLYQGITITEADLVQIEIPPEFLPGGTADGIYLAPEEVVGRVPRERILANEFIREERLADPESGTGLNALIPRGMRAISINIDNGASLSGFLRPGDYVDMVVTIRGAERNARAETLTLLQAVYVLAVNDLTNRTKNESEEERGKRTKKRTRRVKPSVTLAVYPDQAEAIVYASGKGKITLTLRNQRDLEFASDDDALVDGEKPDRVKTDIFAVLGIEPPKPEVVKKYVKPKVIEIEPEPEAPTLQIIRGAKTSREDKN